MSNLGMELSKVLFAHEPKLLACDLEASGRAAAEVSSLLGCILATLLVSNPDQFNTAFKAVMQNAYASAERTASKAAGIVSNITEH